MTGEAEEGDVEGERGHSGAQRRRGVMSQSFTYVSFKLNQVIIGLAGVFKIVLIKCP